MALSFSGALFTDSDDVAANQIQTGTLSLDAPTTNVNFSLTKMAPGDEANQAISLTNDGNLELRYDMSTAATDSDATNPLSAQLTSLVYLESEEDTAADDGNVTCDATYAEAGAFTTLNSGALGAAALTDRVVAAQGTEVLCVAVELPDATGNEYQTDTSDVTFTFSSEQTVNN